MSTHAKKILLSFSSYAGKELLREIFSQLERRIRIDFAPNENDIAYYLSRQRNKLLPGLIIFDNPPTRSTVAEFINNLRKDTLFALIPIALLLSPADSILMKKWLQAADVFYFPRASLPSECKLYARQMLECYSEVDMVNS
jgi:hypothetical protein